MNPKRLLCWLWRDVASVAVSGTVGMLAVELAWTGLHLAHPPRSFMLAGGVVLCSWLHPRLSRLVPTAS